MIIRKYIKHWGVGGMMAETLTENTRKERLDAIASDLHDGVSQQLVTMLWQLEELKVIDDRKRLGEGLSMLADGLRSTLNDIQKIIYGIRPVLIDQQGLQQAINHWVKKQLLEINFSFSPLPTPLQISRFVAGQIFRVIREGVNNIVRHAQAKNVALMIIQQADYLEFILTDDGRGFQLEDENIGLGLALIKEYALTIESDVQIISQLGGGTTLKMTIPYKGVEAK